MQASVMFVDCPAYMSDNGSARCGLPAEVEGQYTMRSTDGPLESAKIRCPRGHWFNGPVEFLTIPGAGAGRPFQIVVIAVGAVREGWGRLHDDPDS